MSHIWSSSPQLSGLLVEIPSEIPQSVSPESSISSFSSSGIKFIALDFCCQIFIWHLRYSCCFWISHPSFADSLTIWPKFFPSLVATSGHCRVVSLLWYFKYRLITASSFMLRFHYLDLFLSNEVDMAMFTTLNSQDLISIGVASFGARKIMLNAIEGTIFNLAFQFPYVWCFTISFNNFMYTLSLRVTSLIQLLSSGTKIFWFSHIISFVILIYLIVRTRTFYALISMFLFPICLQFTMCTYNTRHERECNFLLIGRSRHMFDSLQLLRLSGFEALLAKLRYLTELSVK